MLLERKRNDSPSSVVLSKLSPLGTIRSHKQTVGFTAKGLKADICRKSFFEFVKAFWHVVIPEEPVWNWHIEYICNQVQRMSERVFQNLPKEHDALINVPPGTSKSTLLSIMHCPWTWATMPTAKTIAFSHTQELVLDFARKARAIVQSDLYQELFPEIELKEDQNKMGLFANTHGGWRLSVTVGGKSPTGFHGHFLIGDDPIDPKKAGSEAEIKIANDFMTDTLPTRKVDKSVAVTILIMQRLRQDDPSGDWLRRVKESGGKLRLKHVCLPAELTDDVKPKGLRQHYRDGLLDPVRLGAEVLEEARLQGQYPYAGQYLQNPIPAGGLLFDVSKLIIDQPPPDTEFRRLIRFWDNASSAGSGDYTAGVKIGITKKNQIWVLHVSRGQWNTAQREKVKDHWASMDGKHVEIGLEQEPGSGGKDTVTTTASRLGAMGYRVVINKPTGDKILRADPFSVVVNNGAVWVAKNAWNETYIDELKFFPFGRYDDQVDASSGAYNVLSQPVIRVGALFHQTPGLL